MRRRSRSLACLIVAASLAIAASARAYVRERSEDGKYDLIWPNPAIPMTVLTGGPQIVPPDDFVAAAMSAAATWSDPALDASVVFSVLRSDAAPAGPALDHLNTISFRSSWDPADGYDPGQLALTTVWTSGGAIVDTDTEVNAVAQINSASATWALLPDDPAAAALSPDVDLQSALTHELGHVLGLDHPCYLSSPPDPPEVTNDGAPVPACSDPTLPASVRAATLFPSAARGSIGERTLSSDEVLALHELYPAGEAPHVEGEDPGGCAVAGGASAPASAAPLAAAFLFARRRRGRPTPRGLSPLRWA